MSFVKEAKERWGAAVPPFFVKIQVVLGLVAAAGVGLVAVPLPQGWEAVSKIGAMLIAGGGIGIIVAQFVVKVTAVLAPGETLKNETGSPVTISTSVSQEEAVDGLTVTKTTSK